jgi:hypothetical protein
MRFPASGTGRAGDGCAHPDGQDAARFAPNLALIQTGLGNKSEALALLEMSYEQHEAALALLKVDPRWDPLRGEPRFQQLLHELSLDK